MVLHRRRGRRCGLARPRDHERFDHDSDRVAVAVPHIDTRSASHAHTYAHRSDAHANTYAHRSDAHANTYAHRSDAHANTYAHRIDAHANTYAHRIDAHADTYAHRIDSHATHTPIAPTPTPTTAPVASGAPDVQIACVFYDGVSSRAEPDEYVEIVNRGDGPQDLAGWTLGDISDGAPEFTFPSHMLGPGARIRVYTDQVHPGWGGFTFGRSTAVWNNSDADTAGLFDGSGVLVSSRSYPPGCG